MTLLDRILGREEDRSPEAEKLRGKLWAIEFLAGSPDSKEIKRVKNLLAEGLQEDPRPAWARGAWDVFQDRSI